MGDLVPDHHAADLGTQVIEVVRIDHDTLTRLAGRRGGDRGYPVKHEPVADQGGHLLLRAGDHHHDRLCPVGAPCSRDGGDCVVHLVDQSGGCRGVLRVR